MYSLQRLSMHLTEENWCLTLPLRFCFWNQALLCCNGAGIEAAGGFGFIIGEEGEPSVDDDALRGGNGQDGGAVFTGGDADGGYARLREEGYENGFVGRFGAAGAGVGEPGEYEIAFSIFLYPSAFGWGRVPCETGCGDRKDGC